MRIFEDIQENIHQHYLCVEIFSHLDLTKMNKCNIIYKSDKLAISNYLFENKEVGSNSLDFCLLSNFYND